MDGMQVLLTIAAYMLLVLVYISKQNETSEAHAPINLWMHLTSHKKVDAILFEWPHLQDTKLANWESEIASLLLSSDYLEAR